MKKLLSKKGFTLMEMLIVVAIIVILVAISIPTFANSLESAKKATDAANFRSAEAAFVMQTMNGADPNKVVPGKYYYYDFKEGMFIGKNGSVEFTADTVKTAAESSKSLAECTKHMTGSTRAYITIKWETVSGTTTGKVMWLNGTTYTDACPD